VGVLLFYGNGGFIICSMDGDIIILIKIVGLKTRGCSLYSGIFVILE
jgi:hypothetical protein